MTRDERIDALLAMFTCPHCGEIRDMHRSFNGVQICDACHGRACAGYPKLINIQPVAAPVEREGKDERE